MKKLVILGVLLSFLFSIQASAHAEDMVKIRGAYGASMGFQTDKFTWKNANGDYQEKNWRYIDQFEGVNTYDQRIFDRYRLEIQTDTKTPWNGYTEIVVDPWSFVGTAEPTVINPWNDSCQIK